MEEMATGWSDLCIGALLAQVGAADHQAPPPSFKKLIAEGTVVPDEHNGPYALASYHANVTGAHRGYKAAVGYEEWHASNKAIMALQTSWGTIDFEAENAVDPEYMFTYGAINGFGVDMRLLRPMIIEAQGGMKEGYGAAFESARGKPGAAEVYLRIAALPQIDSKVRQPRGEQLDLLGLYKGALGAVGKLWEYGQQALVASGEAAAAASWGIKKALRIWFKLTTKYGGDVSKVTDCARISLEFATAEGLERAATFVLQAASTFKNRVANPTDEGYRDLMFTVLVSGHVCEVQLQLVEMIKAKKGGVGHTMYKVCRRVLNAPIVKKDTYCLEVIGNEPRGSGEVNAQGGREGQGTMVYASGDMYEGQWLAGEKQGRGKLNNATGNVYEGEWAKDERHGHGTDTYANGDLYDGQYVKDEKQGCGKYGYSSGDVYDGEWAEDKRHGIGTFSSADGGSYEGEFVNGDYHGRGKRSDADGDVYEGEFQQGLYHGRGKKTHGSGSSYDGEWADNEQHGSGTYTYASGAVDVSCYKAGADVGQGVRWSADRVEAWELRAGEEVRSIPLDEAAKIAERIGLPVP